MIRGALFLFLMLGTMTAKDYQYPKTTKDNTIDDYHGTKIADPYRWLENSDSPETVAWINQQNALSLPYLEKLPSREEFQEKLTRLLKFERYSAPYWEGGRYIYEKNDGLQNQDVIYTVRELTDAPEVVIDPNKLAADGTISVSTTALSSDGKFFAYGLETSGSDWNEIHVRDLQTNRDLPDTVRWVKFSGISWTKDNLGFFYTRYPGHSSASGQKLERLHDPKIYYHRLGDSQDKDQLIYERPDHPEWLLHAFTSKSGRYLIITVSENTVPKSAVYAMNLGEPTHPKLDSPLRPVFTQMDARYEPVEVVGDRLLLRTDKNASKFRLLAVDLTRLDQPVADELVPESKDLLEEVLVAGGKLVLNYLVDAKNQLTIASLDGKTETEVPLPTLGSVDGLSADQDRPELFYSFASFVYPPAIYRYDVTTGKNEVFRKPSVQISSDDYETKQIFYNSKDGTRVPMFIVYRKGTKLDGTNPLLLTGYGGFNVSVKPGFSYSYFTWLEKGGVFAEPNLRGGGEYGQNWHQAGTKERKQNVFDDFIAAAETLISEKYTNPKHLGILGGSNGGLLVGACLTQHPDLFGATVPAVGVLDMLRYQKFTIGSAWISDYGSSDNPDDFKYLIKYSPLHNVHPGTCYPPTLITTADHDDRVVPGHSFKFAATLQAAQGCDHPILIRVDTKAGHGGGKPIAKIIEERADQLSFLWDNIL
ncbi:MAG TPA: prolyl oligopeptidase family serine peptidase [Chthoniobacterales bacterium]|nr:prolyl oligopeptidase family serine peptidase [Chthoniobacterales bacterium]